MCWVRQHHVATSRHVQMLDANNLQGSLLRKGCQNCQNPKLLGQSLIQEQWHRKPQPICGCVWGLGCSTNKGAIAHTRHITTHISNDSAELHSYQMQHSGWRGFALQRHVAATQSLLHIGQTWPNEKKTQMVRCLAIAMSLKIWKTERPFMSRNKHGQTFRPTGTLGWAMQQFDSLRYNRLSTTLPLFVSGTTLSNQLCVERGNITLPLQDVKFCLIG